MNGEPSNEILIDKGPVPDRRRSTGTPPWNYDAIPCHAGAWSVRAAKRYCFALARSHYENFPVFLSMFGKEEQEALAAVYAFARLADDFADEPEFDGLRGQLLDQWESQLVTCFKGEAAHPVFVAMKEAIARFGMEKRPFLDLLDAFRQDCHKKRYETFEELSDYCRRSANPVGRIVLKVLGIDRPDFIGWSDKICTALQLTNFWQDVSVDLKKDRVYLPLEDMESFHVSVGSLFAGRPVRSFNELILFEANRTRELFREGRPLIGHTGFPERFYFAGVWLGGRTVLRMVKDLGAKVLHRRPVLKKRRMARVWLKAAPAKFLRYAGGGQWIQ